MKVIRTTGTPRTNAIYLFILLAGLSSLASAQLAHFVSPQYPPLARDGKISGQVNLKLTVAKDGKVTNVLADGPPNLAQPAKVLVREWKFEEGPQEHTVTVTLHYRFSDTPREYPKTIVEADFASRISVFVTTDGVPVPK